MSLDDKPKKEAPRRAGGGTQPSRMGLREAEGVRGLKAGLGVEAALFPWARHQASVPRMPGTAVGEK